MVVRIMVVLLITHDNLNDDYDSSHSSYDDDNIESTIILKNCDDKWDILQILFYFYKNLLIFLM